MQQQQQQKQQQQQQQQLRQQQQQQPEVRGDCCCKGKSPCSFFKCQKRQVCSGSPLYVHLNFDCRGGPPPPAVTVAQANP
ncbi:hypothetical protein Emag_002115 [Eimeria magna]